jgi:hypothetical protein
MYITSSPAVGSSTAAIRRDRRAAGRGWVYENVPAENQERERGYTMGKPPSPALAAFFQRIHREILPRITRATVPFYVVQNDRIVRDRSGVLLRVGDEHFLLTASHYLKAKVQNSTYLYAGWCEETAIPVPLADAIFHTSEEESRDLAVVKLSSESATQLMSSSTPITLLDVARQCSDEKAYYVVCGYPQEWLRVMPDRIESAPLNYLCATYRGDPLPTDTFMYDARVHLLLDFTRDAYHIQSSQPATLPAKEGIVGISGCGVWRIVGESSHEIKNWKPEDVKLVGIEHRYWQKQGAVAATKVQFLMAFLAESFPQVVPGMNIIYP